jgi:hypothetical protein
MALKISLLSGILIFVLASAGESQNSLVSGKVNAVVPYPKIRIWTTPSAGEEPNFNSPSLQWPTKKKASYGVRISPTRDFSGDVITGNRIPYAIFNPHKKLQPGLWYWQYRVNEGKWNQPDSFVIKSSTRVFVTPDSHKLQTKITSAHPRVLIKKTELDELRKRAANYKEAVLLIKEADGYLNKPAPSESSALPSFKGKDNFENEKIASISSKWAGWNIHKVIITLSQAYILTGEKKYFNTAKTWMLEISKWDPNGPSHTNNFGDAGIMSGLAIGVDTFWDVLSAAERNQIIRHTTIRASQFYNLWINQVESRSSSMHVWQHILHNLLQTSLALKGEIPEAEQWFEYVYELWIAQSPKMGEEDGAWFNGTSYFGMNTLSLIDVSSIFKDLSGTDFMTSEWFQNNPRWLIYAFPPKSVSDGFCNDGERYQFPIINYAGYADAMARLLNLPYAGWYAQTIAKSLGKEIADDEEFRWFRIRSGLKMKYPATVKEFMLPQAARFPDIGVAYMHTSLQNAQSDLMLSLRSSPYGPMAHAHADQNTFNIAYGGKRLFYNTGYRPAMGDPHFLGWYKHTQGHNGILIDGEGQPFSDAAYGWIPRFLHGNQLSYAVGDAANAYSGAADGEKTDRGMKLFRRHYLMLRPSTIVIYDELEADHNAGWSWLLHNDTGLEIDPKTKSILAKNDAAYARVSLYASSPVDYQVTDQFTIPIDNWTNKTDEEGDTMVFKNQWHFKAISKEKTKSMRYLAIFQVKPDSTFENITTDKENSSFTIGDWKIEAEMNSSKSAGIKVWKSDNSASLVSGGDLLFRAKTYKGQKNGSSKLLEVIDGKEIFQEATDEIPASILKAMRKN